MKNKVNLSYLLIMIFFLFTMPISVSALNTETQEGLEVNINTDKEEYSDNDDIHISVSLKNTNKYKVKNISIETLLPEDFVIKSGELSITNIIIDSGESYSNSIIAQLSDDVKESQETEPQDKDDTGNDTNIDKDKEKNPPGTGDDSNIAFWSTLLIISVLLLIFAIIKKKKTTKIISLFLCVTILGTVLPLGEIVAEGSERLITVDKTINVGDKEYTIKSNIVIETKINDDEHIVSFDLNYDGATNTPKSQFIKHGFNAIDPGVPEREGYYFAGWFTNADEENISLSFDFESEITSDITLFAKWIEDIDTDNDGLIDYFEKTVFNTNALEQDTDGDYLSDYYEVIVLGIDPLKIDTDMNGINDGNEDFDGDNINNLKEQEKGTSPVLIDTDNDGLNDKDEIEYYNTDPLNEDTDEDGVKDSDEIKLGLNPLDKDSDSDGISDGKETYNIVKIAEGDHTDQNVSPKIEMELAGNQISTLSITKIDDTDMFLSKNIPGFIGCGYDFNVEGDFEKAKITFDFDESLLNDPEFIPRIYWFDEDNQTLEEVPNQTVSRNSVTAEVTHFSKYILCAKDKFDKAWNINIQAKSDNIELVLLIDSSASMSSSDPGNIRLTVANNLVSKLNENDLVSVVSFDAYPTQKCGFTKDKHTAYAAITSVGNNGSYTYIGSALNYSLNIWDDSRETNVNRFLVLLTDGISHDYFSQYSSVANSKDVTLYTVGLGSDVQDSELSLLAAETGGCYYPASNASELYSIFDDILEQIDTTTDTDNDGISDYHEKKIASGELTTGTGIQLILGEDFSLKELDWQNSDSDGDGLLDGEEIEICSKQLENKETVYYAKFISNPMKEDTDGDGYTDYEEVKGEKIDGSAIKTCDGSEFNPLQWNVSDRDLLICAGVVYDNLPVGSTLDQSSQKASNELKRWEVITTSKNNFGDYCSWAGMQAAAYKCDNNIVIAYRGTEINTLAGFFNDVLLGDVASLLTGLNVQTIPAKNFVRHVLSQYGGKGYNIYVTGHSLGGYLSYMGAVELYDGGCTPKKVDVFNGYGVHLGVLGGFTHLHDMAILENICDNWGDFTIRGDIVSRAPLTCHYGTREVCTGDGIINVISNHYLDYFYNCKEHFHLTSRS